jgi:hypothetical protein
MSGKGASYSLDQRESGDITKNGFVAPLTKVLIDSCMVITHLTEKHGLVDCGVYVSQLRCGAFELLPLSSELGKFSLKATRPPR